MISMRLKNLCGFEIVRAKVNRGIFLIPLKTCYQSEHQNSSIFLNIKKFFQKKKREMTKFCGFEGIMSNLKKLEIFQVLNCNIDIKPRYCCIFQCWNRESAESCGHKYKLAPNVGHEKRFSHGFHCSGNKMGTCSFFVDNFHPSSNVRVCLYVLTNIITMLCRYHQNFCALNQ